MSTETTPPRNDRDEVAQPGTFRRLLRRIVLLVAAFAAAGLLLSCIVMVDETEYVIVERLGTIAAVYDQPADRGLHVKWPWPIDRVRRFDRRLQLFDPPAREIFTRDKKNVTVDPYVCWKIADPKAGSSAAHSETPVVRFFRSLGSIDIAEARLDSRVRSVLSTQVGQVELSELLDVRNSEQGPSDDGPGSLARMAEQIRKQVIQQPGEVEALRDRLGIEIVDVRIQRLNLPSGNQQAVFERMKSERRKIADRYRSAGLAENRMIKSQADRQYAEILAKAERQAEEIRGEAEAEAVEILNKAHGRDPEFYRVMRTLDTYRTILNEKTTLVLSASSKLLELLSSGIPNADLEPKEGGSAPTVGESSGPISPKLGISEAEGGQ